MNIDLKLLKKQRNHLNNILADDQAIEILSKAQKNALQGIQNLLDALSDEQEDKFPNGFTSWIETHHEVVSAITIQQQLEEGLSYKVACKKGTGGLYELAEELTDKFEEKYKDAKFDGDFFEIIKKFLNEELKEQEG